MRIVVGMVVLTEHQRPNKLFRAYSDSGVYGGFSGSFDDRNHCSASSLEFNPTVVLMVVTSRATMLQTLLYICGSVGPVVFTVVCSTTF